MPSKERRGKWQAFDALEGYKYSLKEADIERERIPRPTLMPDKIEELNRVLQNALAEDKDVKITYYRDGYLNKVEGKIDRLDPEVNKIKVRGIGIKLRDIIDIEE
ncbi:MAG TPA: YolD-like family protein [Bacilli bacterium]